MTRVVRWGDCDPAGVVYAARYSEYLVDAVMSFLDRTGYGVTAPGGSSDVGLPCKHMALTFNVSLFPGDVIDIDVRVAEIREHTFDLVVKARLPDERLAFEGSFAPICIDRETRKRVRIPVGLRQALALHFPERERKS
jgi:YbgC/YbaW family acyl-CoA thioester hydrolase